QRDLLLKKPDLFFEACRRSAPLFISYIFGVRMSACHLRIHELLDRSESAYVEACRGLGKSINITVGRSVWELGRNPDLRISIVQNSLPEARKTVQACKSIIESEKYRKVFPHVVPAGNDKWGAGGLTIKRELVSRDPSISANSWNGRAG